MDARARLTIHSRVMFVGSGNGELRLRGICTGLDGDGGDIPTGHACVAVCQLGFQPVVSSVASETFTCPAEGQQLQPTSGSSFACVEDKREQCSAAPPCEDDGCEWTTCTDPLPGALHNLCTAECRAGFYTPRADTVRYECVPAAPLGMNWVTQNNVEPLVCTPLCSTVPPLGGQHWRTGGASDRRFCGAPPYTDQSCQVGCDVGFDWAQGTNMSCKTDTDWDTGSRIGWFSCEAGTWQREELVECICAPKVCAATLPVPHGTPCPHGHYQSPGSNQTAAVCHVQCNVGYERIAGSGVFACSSDGGWEPHSDPLACKRTCTARLPVLHAEPHGCKGLGGRELPVAGERCSGECAVGYVENELATYTCSDEGEWESESGSFSCVADFDAQVCHSDAPAKNLHFLAGCNHTLPGVHCNAACDEGHTGDGGDPTFICDAAGRWVPKSFNRLDCSLNRCPTGQAPQVASSGSTHCTICVPGDTRKLCQFTLWDWICGVTTIITVLCVPFIICKFKKDLKAEITGPPLTLPRGEDALGWVGVAMFATGILDLGLDISLCLALSSCNQPYLLASCLTTLLVTMGVTIHLGFSTLDQIREGNGNAGEWWIKNGSLASLTVIASSSRIESLAILKLRLCEFHNERLCSTITARNNIMTQPVSERQVKFLTRHEGGISFHFISLQWLFLCLVRRWVLDLEDADGRYDLSLLAIRRELPLLP